MSYALLAYSVKQHPLITGSVGFIDNGIEDEVGQPEEMETDFHFAMNDYLVSDFSDVHRN